MDLPDDFDPETHEVHGYFAVNFTLDDTSPYRPGVQELYYALARAINVTSASAAIVGEERKFSPDIKAEMDNALDECWAAMNKTDAPLEHMLGAVGSISDNIAISSRSLPHATIDMFHATMTSCMFVVKDLGQRWLNERGITATIPEPEPPTIEDMLGFNGPDREQKAIEDTFGDQDDSDS